MSSDRAVHLGCLPSLAARIATRALSAGAVWMLLTIAFEVLYGHFVMGHPLSRLLHDYNLAAGRIWLLFLAWLVMAPYLFHGLQRIRSRDA